jgi:predicted PurR-regulated permease PerM
MEIIQKSGTGEELKLPYYAKVTIFLIGLIALTTILYVGKSIIVPIIFATIFAIMLKPVINFLMRMRMNRIIAISITVILVIIVVVTLGILLFSRVIRFSDSWPMLVDKFKALIDKSIIDASGYLDISPQKIHDWLSKTQGELINTDGAAIEKTLVIIGNRLLVLVLLPIYIFLILYYQPIILGFIHRFFGNNNKSRVTEIITQTKTVIQQYLFGRLIEAFIVAVLYYITLMIVGIEHAMILAIIGSLINVIPYIGGVISVALPMMVALVTKSSPIFAVYILVGYYIIVLIDNHYIVPFIVASKVKINALFSIIVVLAGNALWGIPGMFLSLPLLAIIKVVCDNIESLKPWGLLIGDSMPHVPEIDSDLDIKG